MRITFVTIALLSLTLPLNAQVMQETVQDATVYGSTDDIGGLLDAMFGEKTVKDSKIKNAPEHVELTGVVSSITPTDIDPTKRAGIGYGDAYKGGQVSPRTNIPAPFGTPGYTGANKNWNGSKASPWDGQQSSIRTKQDWINYARGKNPFQGNDYSGSDKEYATDMYSNKKNVPHYIDNARDWKKERNNKYTDRSLAENFSRQSYEYVKKSLTMADLNRYGFRYSGTQGAYTVENQPIGGSFDVNESFRNLGNTSNGGTITIPTSAGGLKVKSAGGGGVINKR